MYVHLQLCNLSQCCELDLDLSDSVKDPKHKDDIHDRDWHGGDVVGLRCRTGVQTNVTVCGESKVQNTEQENGTCRTT